MQRKKLSFKPAQQQHNQHLSQQQKPQRELPQHHQQQHYGTPQPAQMYYFREYNSTLPRTTPHYNIPTHFFTLQNTRSPQSVLVAQDATNYVTLNDNEYAGNHNNFRQGLETQHLQAGWSHSFPKINVDKDKKGQIQQQQIHQQHIQQQIQQQQMQQQLSQNNVLTTQTSKQPHVARPNHHSERETNDTIMPKGCNGLWNLGNTCYMNCILQCLARTAPLFEYLCPGEGSLKLLKNKSNHLKGDLVNALCHVMARLRGASGDVINPERFRRQMKVSVKCFEGVEQEDAQEFLMFLLQGVSKDLSKGTVMSKKNSIRMFNTRDKRADKAWKKYLDFENTPIIDIFMGQLKSTLTCASCSSTSHAFDPVMGLSLSLPCEQKSTTLTSCLKLYFQEEMLKGEEKTVCQKCKTKSDAAKMMFIQKFPKILIIHLKRFSYDLSRKVQTMVECPMHNLNFNEFAYLNAGLSYDLYAVSSHYGTPTHGHYTATVRNEKDAKWYSFDDHIVEEREEDSVINKHAYILFYQLKYSNNADRKQNKNFTDLNKNYNSNEGNQSVENNHLTTPLNNISTNF